MSTTKTNVFLSYGKTGGLAQAYRQVNSIVNYRGRDDKNEPIFASNVLPTVVFTGTAKLHGTNAAVGYNDGEIWFQSKSQKVGDAHYGFTQLPPEDITNLIASVKESYNLPYNSHFVVYGEWAGEGIQKTCAISKMPKRFYVFHVVLIVNHIPVDLCLSELMLESTMFISDVSSYWQIVQNVDFSKPHSEILAQLMPLVKEIEKQCPVAAAYDVKGICEGIVFVGSVNGHRIVFKLKGDLHKVAKKEKIEIDPVKRANIDNFADNFVTPERIKQAVFALDISKSFGITNGENISKKDTGAIVKWVKDDIMEEESETLAELGLVWGDVTASVSKLAAKTFFDTFNLL